MEYINIILLQSQVKNYILELLVILILQYTRMKKERKDIFKGKRIEKIGQYQELTQLVGGRNGIYEIYQQKNLTIILSLFSNKYIV